MARILVVAQPELGHILPLLPILETLRQAGHEIIVMSTKQTRWLLDSRGIRIELWVDDDNDMEVEESRSGYSFWYRFTQQLRIPIYQAIQRRLETVAELYEPDFYIFDSLFPISYKIDCGRSPYLGRCTIIATMLPRWDVTLLRMPYQYIILCPAAFEVPRFIIRHPMVHYVEPSCSEGFYGDEEKPSARPMVLTTFGTQVSLQRSFLTRTLALNAIARNHMDIDFVVGMGHHHLQIIKDQTINISTNLDLRANLPQQTLLKRAAAFITHGGLSSIKEAMLLGTPMVVTPEVFDQPFNAMRAEYHRLADAIFPNEISVKKLENSIMAILNRSSQSETVRVFQSIFQESLARPKAANLIQEQLVRVLRLWR